MDFLDIQFASVNRSHYNDFLGLGNNKQKATAENAYEQDIINRYPFSADCNEQKRLVAEMLAESNRTLSERNSAKKNSKYRNDLTGKLRAFDKYIPEAINFMNTISCAVGNQTGTSTPDIKSQDATSTVPTTGTGQPKTDPVLDTTTLPATSGNIPVTPAGTSLLASLGPNGKKYALFAGGLVLVVGGILLIKHLRK